MFTKLQDSRQAGSATIQKTEGTNDQQVTDKVTGHCSSKDLP
jgi:hypothetical protein